MYFFTDYILFKHTTIHIRKKCQMKSQRLINSSIFWSDQSEK